MTTYELVAPDGTPLADISRIAAGRQWRRKRNDSDYVEFTLSMDKWEATCTKIGKHPRELLRMNWTEVRVKENGIYVAGGRINSLKTGLAAGTINASASGILDAFKKRRTDPERIFTATEGTDLAWTLIDESQSLPNGNLYITRGPNQATAGPHDRTYKRTMLKDALQALTTVETNPFDIEFTPLKEFNTYLQLGSPRPDIQYKWGVNIVDGSVNEDTIDLVNEVDALGSGFGDDAVAEVILANPASQADYSLAQDVITANATDNSDGGLTNEASAYLNAWALPVILIDLQVDGGKAPFVTDYGLGDYIDVDLTGHPWLDGYKGMMRIQEQVMSISDDNVKTLTLTVST